MTIAILIGNSGIIEQAREAKNNTQKALENENEILGKFISKINKITSENLNENEENNSTKGNAKQIRENAKNTYVKEVSNYIVKDAKGKEIQADKDVKWKNGNSLKNTNSKYFNAFFERRNNKTK